MSSPSKAERARSFDDVAEAYERGRPGYAPQAVSWVLGQAPLTVVDVGAGTGKLTRALVAAGHEVIAVEPLDRMRELLRRTSPSVRVLAGTAEDLPIEDRAVDAVVAGSAFHWFDAPRALGEFARVLRAPGTLGLLGNTFDTSVGWVGRLRTLLGPPPVSRADHWPATEHLRELFDTVEDREFAHAQQLDLAGLRDLALSRSSIAVLSPAERRIELDRLATLWRGDPEIAGAETMMLPWLTRVRRGRGLSQAR